MAHVHAPQIGVAGRICSSWFIIRSNPYVPWHSDLRHGGDACSACLLLSDLCGVLGLSAMRLTPWIHSGPSSLGGVLMVWRGG